MISIAGAIVRVRPITPLVPLPSFSPLLAGNARTYATGKPVKGTHAKGTSVKGSEIKASKLQVAKEKERNTKEKQRARELKQKEQEKARNAADREKERLQKEKEKEKEAQQRQKEKERSQREKEKEKHQAQTLKQREKKAKAAEEQKKAKEREKREQEKKEKEERPKRALSSYMFFAMEVRPDIVKKNPDFRIAEVAKEIARKWKTLTPEQKKKFEEKAGEDKERHGKALKEYQETHPKPPRRPITSFIAYVKETREKVAQQNPQASNTDVIRLVAQKWKTLTPEQKKVWHSKTIVGGVRFHKDHVLELVIDWLGAIHRTECDGFKVDVRCGIRTGTQEHSLEKLKPGNKLNPFEKLAEDSKSKYEKERKAFEDNMDR